MVQCKKGVNYMSRERIANSLKQNRKKSKLTVGDVVTRLDNCYSINISEKAMYSYESGHRQPDADTLMAMCEIYEIFDILSEFGYKKYSHVMAPDDALTQEDIKIAHAYHDASEGMQESVRKLLDVELDEPAVFTGSTQSTAKMA